ncbi:hypothetical protein ACOMHN_053244 [Nucella lapillus]
MKRERDNSTAYIFFCRRITKKRCRKRQYGLAIITDGGPNQYDKRYRVKRLCRRDFLFTANPSRCMGDVAVAVQSMGLLSR